MTLGKFRSISRRCLASFCLCFLVVTVTASLSARERKQQIEKGQAEILWDTWGVPHIFAQDEASAFRAFGWAQMHSDGNVLVRLLGNTAPSPA